MATITTFDAFVTACRTAVTPRVVSVALRTDTDYLTFADDGSTCGPDSPEHGLRGGAQYSRSGVRAASYIRRS